MPAKHENHQHGILPFDGKQWCTRNFGAYQIVRLVGSGAIGDVFLARDNQLHRDVALKIPRADIRGNPQLHALFTREAHVAASLRHPRLVEVYQFGEFEGTCFLASRWCTGGDLANWMRQHPGPRDPTLVARFVKDLCDAVAHCHANKVLHLDIKPSNILLEGESTPTDPGMPLLADFGLARVVEQNMTDTQSSMVFGTPHYMSPEQVEGRSQDVGPWTDVFALGVLLYQLLHDVRPFDGDTTMQVLDRIRHGTRNQPNAESRTPVDLRTIWLTCLQTSSQDRYASASLLADDLARFLDGRAIRAQQPSPLRHLWLWARRPERIRQASMASLVIHLAVVMLIIHFVAMIWWGVKVPMEVNLSSYLREFGIMLVLFHLPPVAVASLGLRGHRWTVPVELFFALSFLIISTLACFGILSRFELYRAYPEASFIGNLALACFAAGLCIWIMVAMPAALARRHATKSGV